MDLLQKAAARRAALVAELANLDNFIRTAKELMEDKSEQINKQSGEVLTATASLINGGGAHIPNKTTVLNACREIIAERKAVPLKTLLSTLESKGITPGTNNPSIALSVMLSRSEVFKSDRAKGGWTLAKIAPQTEQIPKRAT